MPGSGGWLARGWRQPPGGPLGQATSTWRRRAVLQPPGNGWDECTDVFWVAARSNAAIACCDRTWEVISVLSKVVAWAIVIFIVYYAATDPSGAAGFLKDVLHGLESAGNSMSRFVNRL